VADEFAFHEEGYTVWVMATSDADGTETRSNEVVWQPAR
jgi:hypothetical protein